MEVRSSMLLDDKYRMLVAARVLTAWLTRCGESALFSIDSKFVGSHDDAAFIF
jgi:hypothetical protein